MAVDPQLTGWPNTDAGRRHARRNRHPLSQEQQYVECCQSDLGDGEGECCLDEADEGHGQLVLVNDRDRDQPILSITWVYQAMS